MSERNGLRHGSLGACLLVLFGLLLWIGAREAAAEEPAPALESLAKLSDQPLARRTLDIQSWTTEKGARVLFVEAHQLPMFDLRLTFAAGSSRDDGQPGLAMLTNAMLNEGIQGKDVTAIAQGFEGLGASFENGAYRDMAVAGLRSLSAADKREPALALFSEVVGKPTFPADSLERIKNQMLASFEYQKQNPGKLASLELFRRLYGEHPYAHPSEGTAESIPPIGVADLERFHRRAYAAGNVVIALVGDLTRPQAEQIARQVSEALPAGPALPKLPSPNAPDAGRYPIEFPSNQTHLLLAELGVARGDPAYPALYLGNQVLGGGGFGTRLMTEVREKRGLTYGVYSGFSPMAAAGPFMISLQTRAELAEGTLDLVQKLVREFIADGPSEAELEQAKREVAGSFPLSTASNADIVAQLGSIGFYDLPLTYLEDFMQQIQALTVEQVKAAMQAHLDAGGFVIVTAGPTVEQKALPPPTDHPVAAPLGVPEH